MSLLESITQPWAMEDRKLSALAELAQLHMDAVKKSPEQVQAVTQERDAARLASRPWDSILSSRTPEEQEAGFYVVPGGAPVAVVTIEGVLANRAGLVNGASTPRGMSDGEIQRVVRAASEQARAIVLHIDSPGGTVQGTHETAEVIAEVASRMPVVAFANDMAASKAYWLACMAHEIYAAPSAMVGSIGSMCVIADTSRVTEAAGVKLHVIRSGELKGAGWPGTVVTDKMLAAWQHQIDTMGAQFAAAVSKSRKIHGDKLAQVTDGRVHMPADALTHGLINGVGNLRMAIARAESLITTGRAATGRAGHSTRKSAMNLAELKTAQGPLLAEYKTEVLAEAMAAEKASTEAAVAAAVRAEREKAPAPPAPATRAELKTIVPATMAGREELIGKLQDDNATAAQAQQAVVARLSEQNAALAAELAEARKVSTKLGDHGKGVDPLKFVPGAEGGSADAFTMLVASCKAEHKCTRDEAIVHAGKKDPELYRQWIKDGSPAIKVA